MACFNSPSCLYYTFGKKSNDGDCWVQDMKLCKSGTLMRTNSFDIMMLDVGNSSSHILWVSVNI